MRALVAGIGNVFRGDDGFGVEVARRLAAGPLPEGVVVEDVGIRGLHLAYRLGDGWDLFIAVDAVTRGAAPGTVHLLEPDVEATVAATADGSAPLPAPDPHGIDLASVFGMALALGGGAPARVLVVGCEPADLGERMGLSPEVERAVEVAARRIRALLRGGGATDEDEAALATPPP